MIVLLVVVQNVFGKNEVQTFVSTAEAVTGEIEQVINTSGTVTTEKTKSYFSDVSVKIDSVPVAVGDAVKAGDLLISYNSEELEKEKKKLQFLKF